MVVAQQRFTQVRGAGADPSLYQRKKPAIGKGKRLILVRVWHPTMEPHELGVISTESYCMEGISVGEPLQYNARGSELDGDEVTSPIKTIEQLGVKPHSLLCKVVTETGTVYHALFVDFF